MWPAGPSSTSLSSRSSLTSSMCPVTDSRKFSLSFLDSLPYAAFSLSLNSCRRRHPLLQLLPMILLIINLCHTVISPCQLSHTRCTLALTQINLKSTHVKFLDNTAKTLLTSGSLSESLSATRVLARLLSRGSGGAMKLGLTRPLLLRGVITRLIHGHNGGMRTHDVTWGRRCRGWRPAP